MPTHSFFADEWEDRNSELTSPNSNRGAGEVKGRGPLVQNAPPAEKYFCENPHCKRLSPRSICKIRIIKDLEVKSGKIRI